MWWRAYDEAVDDAKLILLTDKLHRAWFNLLCVASSNGGVLPEKEVYAVKLRMPVAKASALVEELIRRRLFEEENGQIVPHNWNGRQYKSDVSTERVKRFRNGKRNVSETSPESETDSESETDGDGEACARPSSMSTEANEIASEIMTICKIDQTFIPPGWCGALMRIQAWLAQGWPRDIILIGVRKAMSRRDGAPDSVSYFEKPIAREIALQSTPLPTASIIPIGEINVGAPRSSRLIQARDRIIARLDEAASPYD